MLPKFGRKRTDTQDEEEVSLISEEDVEGPTTATIDGAESDSDKGKRKSVSLNGGLPEGDLGEPRVAVKSEDGQLIFDRFPMFSSSRSLLKSLVKFLLNLSLKLWKWTSSFMIAIFFVSWFYGGVYPYIVCLVALLSLGYQISDTLLYQPDSPPESRVLVFSPTQYSLPHETVNIHTKDRVKLHAYLIKQQTNSRSVPTIIYFHGNAGNIGHRLENAKLFYEKLKCNTLLVEYRGYGHSEGTPSEQGFYLDAQAAFEFIDDRADLDSSKIILFGRSLGGAVAIDLASRCDYRDRIAGLIVENTFTSIPDMAKTLFPVRAVGWIPKFFFKNKYDSVKKISSVVCPTLFIIGEKDELIPSRMTSELYNRCLTQFKGCNRFPTGGHNDTWLCKDYMKQLGTFVTECASSNLRTADSAGSTPLHSFQNNDIV